MRGGEDAWEQAHFGSGLGAATLSLCKPLAQWGRRRRSRGWRRWRMMTTTSRKLPASWTSQLTARPQETDDRRGGPPPSASFCCAPRGSHSGAFRSSYARERTNVRTNVRTNARRQHHSNELITHKSRMKIHFIHACHLSRLQCWTVIDKKIFSLRLAFGRTVVYAALR